MKNKLLKSVFGFGGHASEVSAQMGGNITFFVDDEYSNNIALPISSFDPDIYEIMIAVSDPKKREDIVKRIPKETNFFSFIHPTAIIMSKNIIIGEGSFIGAYSILTTNIVIGKHAILNRGNHIGHDCSICDFFSAMPGSIVSGNVSIGDRFYIGTNSSIKEKINICSDVTIGLNSSVVKNITDPGIYVGSPSIKIK